MPLPTSLKLTFLPLRSWMRLDARTGEDVHLLVVEFGDVGKPVVDVGSEFTRLLQIGHDVGLRDAQVDASQVQHVHHVLIAALADDRQHAQIVAVVEHGRHVEGEIEIGAVGIAGDDRDRVLVELLGQRDMLAPGSPPPAAWPGLAISLAVAAGHNCRPGRPAGPSLPAPIGQGLLARHLSPRNQTSGQPGMPGVRYDLGCPRPPKRDETSISETRGNAGSARFKCRIVRTGWAQRWLSRVPLTASGAEGQKRTPRGTSAPVPTVSTLPAWLAASERRER